MSNQSFSQFANAGIRNLTPYEPGKPISELEREYGISDAVKLASNENPLGASPKALAAIQQHLNELAIYPDGNAYLLKQKLASRHDLQESQITIGNGSNEILELIARVYLGPGRNAVFSQHAFAVYPIITQACGARANIAKANAIDSEQPYGHDLDQFLAQIDQDTRVVMIANPNNPTGSWLDSHELKQFLQAVPADVIVVLDEAYFEYVTVADYPDCSQWLADFPNLIVTRTFSKIYGLAALRVGYGLANPVITDMLNRARQPFNVNGLAQVAAVAAIDDEAFRHESVSINQAGLQQLTQGLSTMGLAPMRSVANFISVKVGESGVQVFEKLLEKGVIIRPVDNYQLPGYIRVTIGTEMQNSRFLQALAQVL